MDKDKAGRESGEIKGGYEMSLNITGKYITVFQVEDKEKYIQANLSTGKKDRDGNWTNMSWRARFVGKCKDKASQLKDKDKIEITNGLIENNYVKETKTLWVNVVVFDFDLMSTEQQSNKSDVKQEENDVNLDEFQALDDDEDLPF